LVPRCVGLLEDSNRYRVELDQFREQTETLQALVDDAARNLAAERRGKVTVDAGCATIAPGFVVRGAVVTRAQRPLRPGKSWQVTVDPDLNIKVSNVYYHH
jgi:hypothetical protein